MKLKKPVKSAPQAAGRIVRASVVGQERDRLGVRLAAWARKHEQEIRAIGRAYDKARHATEGQ